MIKSGKMNVIISGASRGIGYQVAREFARHKHNVVAIARSETNLIELKKEFPSIEIIVLDLQQEDIRNVVKLNRLTQEGVDILINNAGQLINKPFLETTITEFKSQFNANVTTAVNLSQLVIPFMKVNSHIINITSMGGFMGSSKFSGLSAYSTSKGALSILTECMAEELKDKKIIVNALALGAVETEMLKKAFPAYKAPLTSEEMAEYIVNFAITGNKFYNGKILPVALSNP